jgi:molecular chaperone GrpE
MTSKKKRARDEQAAAAENAARSDENELAATDVPWEEVADEAAAEEAAAAPPEAELSLEEQLRRERDDYQDRWLRAMAELDNYRKRSRRELEDVRRFAVADFLRSLLEVLDNFERALQVLDGQVAAEGNAEGLRQGVELIHQRFQEILRDGGLSQIEAEGIEFDPALHEAIQQVEQEGVPAGTIVGVVQPGYKLHDLVLRPSRVIVAK